MTEREEIIHCSDSDAADWNNFLDNCPTGNFYQRFEWKGINERAFGHRCDFLALERDNAIQAVLPLVHVKSRLFGHLLASMPFVNFGGPAAGNAEDERAIVEAGKRIAEQSGVDYLELRCDRALDAGLPQATHKVSMTIPLKADPDEQWSLFKSKHRTQIRRVFKENVRVENGRHELLDTFYQLYCQSWRELGTPVYQKAYFRDILDALPEHTRIFVAFQGDTPIATAFNGYYKDVVEGMWAAVAPEARRLNPNYALYWEMIKRACENGYGQYHLGRSTAGSGAEQFKQKWNAEAKQLYWHYHLVKNTEMPALNADNPKFDLAIKVWRKLPLPVTQWLGPMVARSIP